VLNLPWIIKPIYGIVSNFVPLFGYRRKAYRFSRTRLAAAVFFWVYLGRPSRRADRRAAGDCLYQRHGRDDRFCRYTVPGRGLQPQRAGGFAFAALMSMLDLSSALSNNLGSFFYEHDFYDRLAPLIVVSAALRTLIFLFVPLLRLGDKAAEASAR
jgi:BT1 family